MSSHPHRLVVCMSTALGNNLGHCESSGLFLRQWYLHTSILLPLIEPVSDAFTFECIGIVVPRELWRLTVLEHTRLHWLVYQEWSRIDDPFSSSVLHPPHFIEAQ